MMTFQEFQKCYQRPLNPQQEAAVQAINGAILLLAVPGSGKTTVLVTRLGYMILGCGIPAEKILTMTYTVAAAKDMGLRFQSYFGKEISQPEFRTINALCVRIIKRYEVSRGTKAFSLIKERDATALLSQIYHAQQGEYLLENTRKTLQTGITYIKNSMLRREEIDDLSLDGIKLAPIYYAYIEAMRENCRMDYDDQLVYALRILKTCPDILNAMREQYHYICVDEAQDTSRIQHEIIRLLAGNGNVFMVGDEDQSIYGFRAAYPQALTSFREIYPSGRVLLLEQNYRSTKQIVGAADAFIQKNINRHQKAMKATRGEGPELKQIYVYHRMMQCRYLLKVATNCETETAVLYRNNESALPLIDLFEREGIDYQCKSFDPSFFTHWSIQDVKDILYFAQHPTDGECFLRIYYKFGARISKEAANKAVQRSAKCKKPIFEILQQMYDLSDYSKKRCEKLGDHLKMLKTESASDAILRLMRYMGYGRFLEERQADTEKLQILEILSVEQPSLAKLFERLQELNEIVRRGGTGKGIILSTIHSAKGLEYQRVFLADVVDGILPAVEKPSKSEEQDSYEEERRLFYVAMTRAKDELFLFRFRAEGLESSFAEELFPEKKHSSPDHSASVSKAEFRKLCEAYSVGDLVVHRSFGLGRITKKTEDIIAVQFRDSGEKMLYLPSLISGNILAKVKK